jgi:endoglucanase
MMDEEERKKGVKIDDMFIDIGAKNREEVEYLGIEVGTPVTVDREFTELAYNRVSGKAFDNRAGVAMLINIKKMVPLLQFWCFTVQEKSAQGARTSAYSLDPGVQ